MNNVSMMPAHARMTPQQALEYIKQRIADEGCLELVVAGYYADGEFFTISSEMTRKDGLWLAETLRRHALYGDADDD